jgi:transposase-like protein
MSYRELNFDNENVAVAFSEVKRMFWTDVDRAQLNVTRRFFEGALAADFDSFINAGRYERSAGRRSQRNGVRRRSLFTKVGVIDLQVPRDRRGKYQPCVFERYQRVEGSVNRMIRQMFLSGVSTRKVGDVLAALCGARLSASHVSRVNQELDRAVSDFGNRPLAADYRYLFLDALSVRVKSGLSAKRVRLLVAYGIKRDGSRCLLSYQRAKSESYRCWLGFLENLRVRGLDGRELELIVMDGALGLWAAVDDVYPQVAQQLCWVHKLRNVARCCPKRLREDCVKEATEIMYARSEGVAVKLFHAWKEKWQKQIPKAVKCLEDDFDRLIPVFEFPEAIRKTIRTTNVIERCFREVRRRLKVMGYFQNHKSCDRIVYALFAYFNNKWQRNTEKIKAIKEFYKDAA